MPEDFSYTPDLISVSDEDGKEYVFEVLDRVETDDGRYVAVVDYFENPEEMLDDTADLIVLKSQMDENDEELMVSIDDDDEYQRIGEMFLEKLSAYFEGDGEE